MTVTCQQCNEDIIGDVWILLINHATAVCHRFCSRKCLLLFVRDEM